MPWSERGIGWDRPVGDYLITRWWEFTDGLWWENTDGLWWENTDGLWWENTDGLWWEYTDGLWWSLAKRPRRFIMTDNFTVHPFKLQGRANNFRPPSGVFSFLLVFRYVTLTFNLFPFTAVVWIQPRPWYAPVPVWVSIIMARGGGDFLLGWYVFIEPFILVNYSINRKTPSLNWILK